jgi:hypothetical protein
LNLLAEAIELHRQAVYLRPLGHPGRPTSLNNLAHAVHTRFEQLGDLDALAKAISLSCQTLDICPAGHTLRSLSLHSLARSALTTQFKQLGDLDSLAKAVDLHRETLALRPPGHSHRSESMNNLGNTFGDLESLAEVIDLHRQALALRPPGHSQRPFSLSGLASALRTRFEQSGDFSLLVEAVRLLRSLSAGSSWSTNFPAQLRQYSTGSISAARPLGCAHRGHNSTSSGPRHVFAGTFSSFLVPAQPGQCNANSIQAA